MGRIVAFGEIMLRLSPLNYERFVQSKEFNVVYGGCEANVAVSLANYGKDVSFVTKLPAHELGQAAVNELRRYGVDTSFITRGGDRIGIYFYEKGASQRPSKVIYDRSSSAMAEIKKEDFNWPEIFKEAEWFHFSGITPAISDSCAEITLDAVKAAKEAGVTVSVDLNYRKKLWSGEKAARVMGELAAYCDLMIANEEDAEKVFGIQSPATDIVEGRLSDEGYRYVAKELADRFHLNLIAITLRESYSASTNGWSAMIYDGFAFYKSKKYTVQIVDRVGGGDSFAAGLIFAVASGMDNKTALEFATAASCLKQTIEGDFNLVAKEEVDLLMKGDSSGRVQR